MGTGNHKYLHCVRFGKQFLGHSFRQSSYTDILVQACKDGIRLPAPSPEPDPLYWPYGFPVDSQFLKLD